MISDRGNPKRSDPGAQGRPLADAHENSAIHQSGNPEEIVSLSFPPMPGEYYRRQAARVRSLAHDATTFAIREHLTDVALQYEKLAEGAEAGYRDPQ
jgi:hypothetical protein